MENKICQSCGMPIDSEEQLGVPFSFPIPLSNFIVLLSYSERSASTASLLDAIIAGTCPPIIVRMVLIATRSSA